jgi:DNA polymerase-3 subunit chi
MPEKIADKIAEYIALPSPQDRVEQFCVRTQHLYQNGRTVAVYAPSSADASELDTALWTFRQHSFIPHVRLEEADDPVIEPVVIFSDGPDDVQAEVLFVVTDGEIPAWFERFDHVFDFAPTYDDELREAARERYSACKDAGYRMRFIEPGS